LSDGSTELAITIRNLFDMWRGTNAAYLLTLLTTIRFRTVMTEKTGSSWFHVSIIDVLGAAWFIKTTSGFWWWSGQAA